MNTESKLYQCHYQARDSRNRTKTHCNSQSYKPPRWDHYLSMEEWAIPVCQLLGDNTYVHHSIGEVLQITGRSTRSSVPICPSGFGNPGGAYAPCFLKELGSSSLTLLGTKGGCFCVPAWPSRG